MKADLTEKEAEFLGYLKKALRFSNISIRQKISIGELYDEREDIDLVLGSSEYLLKDVLIDFVLYKKGRAIAGIEIVDEPEEFMNARGEKLMKDYIFRTFGYEFFRVVNMDKLKDAAYIIKDKIRNL
ncbi:MAG: hypothetical protein IJF95_05230 [Erysipelotrichaceae bacterium]|nr:hypothetical protein [Erysipelotrichaceae bacterium]MBR0353713.1 hypothetical protein [Oscillospiraceae bacterium]MBR0461676.1 hypothetical protein [Erysipelotrichaceae bacterium]